MLATWPPGRISVVGELERRRHADGFDGDVGAETAGQLRDDRQRSLARVVDRDVGAELLGGLQPAVGQVDGDRSWLGLNSRAPVIADSPIGPAPTTATTSPGRTWPLSTPTS